MKYRRLWQVLLPLVLLALFAAALYQMSLIAPRAPRAGPAPVLAPLVAVSTFKRGDYPLVIRAQGTVRPRARTMLVAEVNGRVLELAPQFVAGGLVRAGELLLSLEQADYRVAVHTAEAELARARAALLEEQARAAVAREERSRRGLSNSKGTPDLALRKPQLAREQANVDAARATLERARRDLERTRIRAPYDALVGSREVDLGRYITRGTVLGELFDISAAEVRLALTREQLRQLRLPGLKQMSEVENRPQVVISKVFANGHEYGQSEQQERWQGVIDRSERVVESQSRMTYVVARIDDPYGLEQEGEYSELAFGSYVSAEIQAGVLRGVLRIPRTARRSDGLVMVVGEDERIRLRQVSLAHQDRQWLYVSDGLEPGEAVALHGMPTATEGMQVRSRSVEQQLTPEGAHVAEGSQTTGSIHSTEQISQAAGESGPQRD